jgi:ParB family chromosome partitioning protein
MSLGKGLSALLTPTISRNKVERNIANGHSLAEGQIWHIPISSIQPNAEQPRRYFDPQELNELAMSIKEHGILQPVLISEKIDGGYELISGERRWRAAKIAGLVAVPAIIKKLADQQKLEVALVENIQREDLNLLEQAFAYSRLMSEFNLSQQEVADKVGKSRPAVANIIRLLDLPEEIKKALVDKKINYGQARALLGLKDKKQQLEILSSMLGQKITVQELERTVSAKTKDDRKGKHRDPNLVYWEDQLRAVLGTRVIITQTSGKGKIMIDYYSKEELARLLNKINS